MISLEVVGRCISAKHLHVGHLLGMEVLMVVELVCVIRRRGVIEESTAGDVIRGVHLQRCRGR